MVLRDKENPITSLENENEALKNTKSEYEKIVSSYDSEKTLMTNKRESLQKSLDDLPNKKYDVQDKEYSIVFNDVKNKSSLINISGISANNILGNGNIRVASSGMKIDNYSNRSLIFSSIDLASSYKSGLYINDFNFNDFLNKSQAINNSSAILYLMGIKSLENVPTDGIHYISGYGSGEQSGINISNYYDNSNPFAQSEIASDIIFTSSVKSNGNLDVWNESGSIITFGSLDADKTSLISSKGKFLFVTSGDFRLRGSDNYIYGGNGISIFAPDSIDVSNVDMVAGTSSRDITITDDMLNNLIEDPTTGEKNMIDLGSTKKSPYLNSNNNIKAIYKNGEIYLFDVEQSGGEISLVTNGSVTLNPNGTYETSEGYQTISIVNETSKILNVGSISNAKFNGGIYENLERLTDVGQNTNFENGEVLISSNGKNNVNKNILNNIIDNCDKTSLILYEEIIEINNQKYENICEICQNKVYKNFDIELLNQKYYTLNIEEITPNNIGFKYNHTKFINKIKILIGLDYIWFNYIKFKGLYRKILDCKKGRYLEKPSKAKMISDKFPNLKIQERCKNNDFYYYVIAIEIESSDNKKGIGLFCTQEKLHQYITNKCRNWIKHGFSFGNMNMLYYVN